MGMPYSPLTAQLLTSPEISHSPRMVLSSGLSPSTERDTGTREEVRTRGTGHGKTVQRMIPGYTVEHRKHIKMFKLRECTVSREKNKVILNSMAATRVKKVGTGATKGWKCFIPRSQNYFSKSYTDTCREALSEFDSDQKRRIRPATADGLPAEFPDIKRRALNTPLVVISKEPFSYKSMDCWKPLGSPYSMEDDNPHKYFISGFTGYVPKARFLIGSSYPKTTNKALIQLGKQMKASHSAHGLTTESADNLVSLPSIYPTQQGLLPRYTGHVPGYKFRYGQTFGQLTSNSLELSGTRRKIDIEE